jgi:hypothetical protein
MSLYKPISRWTRTRRKKSALKKMFDGMHRLYEENETNTRSPSTSGVFNTIDKMQLVHFELGYGKI